MRGFDVFFRWLVRGFVGRVCEGGFLGGGGRGLAWA